MPVHDALPMNAVVVAVVVVGIVAVDVVVAAVVTMILVLVALRHVNAAIVCRHDSGSGRDNISCSVDRSGSGSDNSRSRGTASSIFSATSNHTGARNSIVSCDGKPYASEASQKIFGILPLEIMIFCLRNRFR